MKSQVMKSQVMKSQVMKSQVMKSQVMKSQVMKSQVMKSQKTLAHNAYNHLLKEFIVILCTIPHDKNIAISLAKTLVTKKLAACVTLFPQAHSIYSWNYKIEEQKEIQLFIKTHISLEQAVFKYIKTEHPYKIPELLTLNIMNGEFNYLLWIQNTLRQGT